MSAVNNSTSVAPHASPPFVQQDGSEHGIGQVSTAMYFTVAGIMTCSCLVGTFFNATALIVYGKNKALRTPTNSFVIALCVCDIFMCLIGMPIPAIYSWRQTTIQIQFICILDGTCIFFFSLSSLYILAAISVDRYVVIVRPLTSSMVTQRMASLAIVVCFLVGLFWTVLPMLGWNRYTLEGIGVACSVSWQPGQDASNSSYVYTVFVFCFLLPLITITFCYVNIYRAIRNIARSSPWGANSHIAQNNYRLERKMLKTVIIMISGFLVSWTPYAMMGLLETVTRQRVVGAQMETFPALIAKMSAVWDPIIYIATNLQFRRAYFELCPCCEVFLAVCGTGDPALEGSQTVMDPESRAVLQNAEADRAAKAQTSSDTPKGSIHPLAVCQENVTIETKISPERQRTTLHADIRGKKISSAVEDLPPVENP